jgi:hypothetical protein
MIRQKSPNITIKDLAHKIRGYQNLRGKRLKKAKLYGVNIAAGADMYMDFSSHEISPGQASREVLHAYVEMGMSPVEVLQASTNGAKLLGVEGKLENQIFTKKHISYRQFQSRLSTHPIKIFPIGKSYFEQKPHGIHWHFFQMSLIQINMSTTIRIDMTVVVDSSNKKVGIGKYGKKDLFVVSYSNGIIKKL